MKKFLPTIIFILLFVKFYAQPGPPHIYVPLAVDSANWIVTYELDTETSPYEYKVYSVIGDTSINSTNYKKVYLTSLLRTSSVPIPQYSIGSTDLFAFVRDSFQTASVYAMHPNAGFFCQPSSNNEYELYDFSIRKNDTVNNCLTNSTDFIIDSTYLQFESAKSRLFFAHNMGNTPFIEGIGSVKGLFELNIDLPNDTTTSSEYCFGTLAGCISVALTNNEGNIPEILIYPNPASNYLLIEGLDDTYDVIIMNSLGDVVKRVLDLSKPVDLSGVQKGIYFLRISDSDSNYSSVRKIVIVD